MSATLHPIFQQALAPFAPPPLRWFRVTGSNAQGRQFVVYGRYADSFQAIEKNTTAGVLGLSAHPMTPEEVAAHRAEFDAIAAEDARTFAEPRRLADYREPRGEYDGFTSGVRNSTFGG
jgi:hypothetical protein